MTKDEFDKLVETNNLKFREDNKHHIDRLTTIVNSEIENYIKSFKYIPENGSFRIEVKDLEDIPKELLHGLTICIVEDLSDCGWEIVNYGSYSASVVINLKL